MSVGASAIQSSRCTVRALHDACAANATRDRTLGGRLRPVAHPRLPWQLDTHSDSRKRGRRFSITNLLYSSCSRRSGHAPNPPFSSLMCLSATVVDAGDRVRYRLYSETHTAIHDVLCTAPSAFWQPDADRLAQRPSSSPSASLCRHLRRVVQARVIGIMRDPRSSVIGLVLECGRSPGG